MRGPVTFKTFIAWLSGFATVGALVLGFVWAFMVIIAYRPPSEVSVPAKDAPEVKRAPTATVQPKKGVKVFAGDTKAKLKLPPDALSNPAEHVISATRVPGSDRPQTITTTVNTDTGESRSFVKTDPYPWFAWEPRGGVRLSLGAKIRDGRVEQVVRMGVNYDALRIKALTAGVTGTVDSDGDAFVGVGVAYRW